MKLEELKISISKMSESELRDFILESRRAQSRYKETMAIAKPKKISVVPSGGKSREEILQATLQSIDPDVLKKLLKEKGIL
jgi:predicted CopG family antitoxin